MAARRPLLHRQRGHLASGDLYGVAVGAHRDLHLVAQRELCSIEELEIGVLETDLERVGQMHGLLHAYQQQSGVKVGWQRLTVDGQHSGVEPVLSHGCAPEDRE